MIGQMVLALVLALVAFRAFTMLAYLVALCCGAEPCDLDWIADCTWEDAP